MSSFYIVDVSNEKKVLYLKLVSPIFYQLFISSPNDCPSKTEKCFLFHLKSFFCSRDIQIFVIFPLPFHQI